MGKFSESNYGLLKTYFDVLVKGRTGDDNSYLHGPKTGIFANGGVHTVLYEETSDFSQVGHKFLITEINGNDFTFQWQGVETINDVYELAVGNKFYFRKDSYFHDWLKNHSNFKDYLENFVNTNKTFIYFGRLKNVTNHESIYIIEFEGMKDFVLKCLPEHNRTLRFSEFLKIYFDEVYHEFYNKTKDLWSMIDPKEVDEKFIDYMASKMNITTNKDKLGGLPLREWVDQLPNWLKRKGTYSAYYALFKTLLTNTRNNLNVYEKWCEWCVQELRRSRKYTLTSDFEDHHILEAYNVQVSGGAGPEYYNQFNPKHYPTYADFAPSASCLVNQYTCGTLRNFNSFTFVDNDFVTSFDDYNIQIDNFDSNTSTLSVYAPKIITDASRGNEFKNCLSVYMDSASLPNGGPYIWRTSKTTTTAWLGVQFQMKDRETDFRKFQLYENTTGNVQYSISTEYWYKSDTPYFLVVEKVVGPTKLRLHVFSKYTCKENDRIETIELNLHEDVTYDIIYGAYTGSATPSASFTGEVSFLRETSGVIQTIGPTGYKILSPHYKVEIDLSTEPIGDTFIIDEDTATEIIRYWEYLKPVSKLVSYHFLLSPLGQIDDIQESVSLYQPTPTRFESALWTICDTRFMGYSVATSAAPTSATEFLGDDNDWFDNTNFDILKVGYSEWQLSGPKSIIQTWNRDNEVVWPKWHDYTNPNKILLEWSDATRGKWFNAHSKPWNKQHIQSVPASAWTITHNMGTSGASGCIFEVIGTDNLNLFPDVATQVSTDVLKLEFSTPVAGTAYLRDEDHIHYQRTASTVWNVIHGHNISGYVVHCYDTNDKQIYPAEITFINTNECRIEFFEAVAGTAVFVIFRRLFKEGDVNNVFIPDTYLPQDVIVGHWKIGNGSNDLFSPETYNDVSSVLASGSLDSYEETGFGVNGSFLINFHVPEGVAYNINEIGVFDKYWNLQYYTKCGDLYKPENVQLDVRYRIRKTTTAAEEFFGRMSMAFETPPTSAVAPSGDYLTFGSDILTFGTEPLTF